MDPEYILGPQDDFIDRLASTALDMDTVLQRRAEHEMGKSDNLPSRDSAMLKRAFRSSPQYYHIPSRLLANEEARAEAALHGKQALLNRLAVNPQVHTFFAQDEESRAVVGIASWTAPLQLERTWRQQALSERLWHIGYRIWDAIMIPIAKRLVAVGYILQKRDRWAALQAEFKRATHSIKDKRRGYWSLDYLAVLPTHHRRGIGGQLLEWGLEQADADDLSVYLSASPQGVGMYTKHGFVALKDKVCFAEEECGDWIETYMGRPRRSERKEE
ncbi:hypothetical protein EMMF5_003237 [Cystobasidiomycetes sp. EMM_F5]